MLIAATAGWSTKRLYQGRRINFRVTNYLEEIQMPEQHTHPRECGCELTLHSLSGVPLTVKQPQARGHYLFYRFHGERQNLVWHDFVWLLGQTAFQTFSPRNAKFCIDVDNVDSRSDCFAQIFIIGS